MTLDLKTLPQRRQRDVLAEKLPLKAKHIIDVGCGDGQLARWMAEQGAHVIGVECSAKQLEKAAKADPVPHCKIVEGVGQALPCPNDSADGVVFFNSLHHVPLDVMAKALEEAARVLKTEGHLYIAEPIAAGPRFELSKPIDDEAEIRDVAENAITKASTDQGPFTSLETYVYLYESVIPNFDHWRENAIAIDQNRAEIFNTQGDVLRAHFEKWGTKIDKGWQFAQPMRINLLQKKAF